MNISAKTRHGVARIAMCLAAGTMTIAAMPSLAASTLVTTPDDAAKRQARSVHLRYRPSVKKIVGAIASVTPREVVPGTYFCTIGWNCGYCGIQELFGGEHVVIFSVWDPGDPYDFSAKQENVKEEHRAKVLYSDPLMDVARFGGEGTGARTMAGYSWKVGVPARLKVTTEPDGETRTAFTCWLQDASNADGWHKLATISTLNLNGVSSELGNLHSFVEDFRRDYKSLKNVRRAEFSGIEVLSAEDGRWHPVVDAVFSADETPSANVDGGRVPGNPGAFFLATGGATTNATTRIWSEVK